jgi:Holliday junction resolvase
VNNKALGMAWERQFCELLQDKGYWVHFITPNKSGAQPFDVIAAKNNVVYAFDCKTAVKPIFHIERLEENQKFAFERMIYCGNNHCYVAIKYCDKSYIIPYEDLKEAGKIDLRTLEGEELKK